MTQNSKIKIKRERGSLVGLKPGSFQAGDKCTNLLDHQTPSGNLSLWQEILSK